ncbi:MAG: DUF2164 family protein [Tepidiformaceae bacterium]
MVIDFFAKLVGPFAYNEAIEDARAIVAERAETVQEELLGLTRKLRSAKQ